MSLLTPRRVLFAAFVIVGAACGNHLGVAGTTGESNDGSVATSGSFGGSSNMCSEICRAAQICGASSANPQPIPCDEECGGELLHDCRDFILNLEQCLEANAAVAEACKPAAVCASELAIYIHCFQENHPTSSVSVASGAGPASTTGSGTPGRTESCSEDSTLRCACSSACDDGTGSTCVPVPGGVVCGCESMGAVTSTCFTTTDCAVQSCCDGI